MDMDLRADLRLLPVVTLPLPLGPGIGLGLEFEVLGTLGLDDKEGKVGESGVDLFLLLRVVLLK